MKRKTLALVICVVLLLVGCGQTSSSMERITKNLTKDDIFDSSSDISELVAKLATLVNDEIKEKYQFVEKIGVDSTLKIVGIELNEKYGNNLNDQLISVVQFYYDRLREHSDEVDEIQKRLPDDLPSFMIKEYIDNPSKFYSFHSSLFIYYGDSPLNYLKYDFEVVDWNVRYNSNEPKYVAPEYHPLSYLITFDFGPFVCRGCVSDEVYKQIKEEYAINKKMKPLEYVDPQKYFESAKLKTFVNEQFYKYLESFSEIKQRDEPIKELIDLGNIDYSKIENYDGSIRDYGSGLVPQLYIALERNDYNWELEIGKVIKEFLTQTKPTNFFSVLLYDNYTNDKTESKNKKSFLMKVYVYDEKDSLNYYSFVYEYFLNGSQKGELNLISKNYVDFDLD